MRLTREVISCIKDLRESGKTINEIKDSLSLSKTTIWHHVKDIKLTQEQYKIIGSKQGGSKKRKELRIQKAESTAKLLLGSKHREAVSLLAMLYWAEGHKKDGCQFTNSDGKMIEMYLLIIRTVFKVPESDICFTIRTFEGMNTQIVLKYWLNVLSTDFDRIKLLHNDGSCKSNTEFGICRITLKKGSNVFKIINALIKLLSNEILAELR